MEILKIIEQNEFYDERKSCNGGGYHQPLLTCTMGTHRLLIDDQSCGDFGCRYTVLYDGVTIYDRDDVDGQEIYIKPGFEAVLRYVAYKLGYCTRRK
jgi:hypothetical protein